MMPFFILFAGIILMGIYYFFIAFMGAIVLAGCFSVMFFFFLKEKFGIETAIIGSLTALFAILISYSLFVNRGKEEKEANWYLFKELYIHCAKIADLSESPKNKIYTDIYGRESKIGEIGLRFSFRNEFGLDKIRNLGVWNSQFLLEVNGKTISSCYELKNYLTSKASNTYKIIYRDDYTDKGKRKSRFLEKNVSFTLN